ncbi:hypothetical protein [Microbacterium sp. A94]|uniref:hypothetical protein n=1 Tax=Microbacterium sp. A94 TaxID=3450717 RepID=UPI003F433FC6
MAILGSSDGTRESSLDDLYDSIGADSRGAWQSRQHGVGLEQGMAGQPEYQSLSCPANGFVGAIATIAGFALADAVGPEFRAGASGFAAGALLVMLVDSMVPDAQSKAKELTGLATVLGFALVAGLSLGA